MTIQIQIHPDRGVRPGGWPSEEVPGGRSNRTRPTGMSRQTSSGPLRQHGGPPPQQIVPAQRVWPAVLGDVPPLAAAFSNRPETGPGLVAELRPGQVTVLASAPGPGGGGRPAAGGEGKTQLAAALARSLWQAGSVDLLVWLTAPSRDAILAGYARGLVAVGAGDANRAA